MRQLDLKFDMDNIVVDLLGHWLQSIATSHRVETTTHDIIEWDLAQCAKLQHLPAADIYAKLYEPSFYYDAPPAPGAVPALTNLHKRGHRVSLLTSPGRPPTVEIEESIKRQKRAWVSRHMPWLTRLDVHEPRILFSHARDKHDYTADVFVDDRPHTLERYAIAHPRALIIGIEYPYNRYLHTANPRIHLVQGHDNLEAAWGSIVHLIDAYAAS